MSCQTVIATESTAHRRCSPVCSVHTFTSILPNGLAPLKFYCRPRLQAEAVVFRHGEMDRHWSFCQVGLPLQAKFVYQHFEVPWAIILCGRRKRRENSYATQSLVVSLMVLYLSIAGTLRVIENDSRDFWLPNTRGLSLVSFINSLWSDIITSNEKGAERSFSMTCVRFEWRRFCNV